MDQHPYNHPPQGQNPQGYYGQPHPVYGPPEQWGPPKKSKLGWILGSIGIALTLCGILLFAGCSMLVNELNGGGGSHSDKAREMVAAADRVPESDWVLVGRSDPRVEAGCVSIDTHCLKLSATWTVDHEVSAYEVADRLGIDTDSNRLSGEEGCIKDRPYDGNSTSSVCVRQNDDALGSYVVSVNMTRK